MKMTGSEWCSGDSLRQVQATKVKVAGTANRYGDRTEGGAMIVLNIWCSDNLRWDKVFIRKSDAENLGLALIRAAI